MSILTERGSLGLKFISQSTLKPNDFEAERNTIRCFKWSDDGKQLVYCNNQESIVVRFPDWEVVTRLPVPRVQFFKWSPSGDQLVTFHLYYETKDNPNPGPNVIFWSIPSGEKMGSFMQKGSVEGWEPHWTADSNFIVRKIGQQLLAYSRAEPTKVAHMEKVEGSTKAAVAPGRPPYKVAVFGPPTSKQPAFVRIFKLPEMKEKLANKAFYKADNCTFYWSSTGNHLLALASTDTSQDSYYGENTLYLLNARNGESQTVELGKKGPIYSVAWAPTGDYFCAVYGFMPAKATLYNCRGDVVFDYGTGARNHCYFNQHSTLLMLCGFGALRGDMECWSLKDNTKLSQAQSADTTHFEWAPDGIHYVCATTAPRLRVSNGWKVSHYHGQVIGEYKYPTNDKNELWEVAWQPNQKTKPAVIEKPSKMVQKIQEAAKPKGYVPPHARGRTDYKAKIRDDEEAPSNPNAKLEAVINSRNNPAAKPSAAALKNKKKREAAKRNAAQQGGQQNDAQSTANQKAAPSNPPAGGAGGGGGGANEAIQKEMKKLRKKLEAIEKLKEKQKNGEELEKNQIEKLATEDDLRKQIEQLQL